MKTKPQRKNLRLKEYDYNNAGYYFVTICTKDRECCLGDVVGDAALCVQPDAGTKVELSLCGEITEKYLLSIEKHYKDIRLHKYCIMPNHIHMILEICCSDNYGTQRAASPTKNSISQTIRSLKCLTGRESGVSLWQRSYYDHVIRNEQDYRRIWEYIDTNPAKWADDEYYHK